MTTTTAIALARSDVPESVPEMMQVANFLQHSLMLPPHLQGEPANLFAVMLKARALNVPMATAFDNIIVQDGRTGQTATLMQALVIRAGYQLFLAHNDDEQATVRAEREGIGPNQEGYAYVSFTLGDAEKATLIKRTPDGKVTARSKFDKPKPWELYTKDMLVWRAIARAAKYYFSDVLMGMVYTPEELGAEVDGEGMPVRVDAIRVDVIDDAVKKYVLAARATQTVDELKALYDEIGAKDMLSELCPNGLTLSQVIAQRKAEIVNAANDQKAARAAKRAEAKARKDRQAAAEQAPEFAAPAAADDEQQAPAETDSSTPVVSEPDPQNPESDFDTLAAPEAPADEDTADTPRRKAVLDYAAKQFGGIDAAESAVVAHFGRPLDTVGTSALQQWLADARKASN